MKIIVQAGGKGTRLEHLTYNKPKCLVAVNNLPMIFHLFQKFSDCEFIIIADYKINVLEKYLQNFFKGHYVIVHSNKNGNASGIREALNYVSIDEQFMIIWSDLILSEDFKPQKLPKGNYIGILENSLCSWSYIDGQLEKKSSDKYGVGGCFIFENRELLKDVPLEGSFTEWLKKTAIELKPISMLSTVEVGTIDAIKKIEKNKKRCRPYNSMEFNNDTVVKIGLTGEGISLIDKECTWYEKISKYGFSNIPKIYSRNPLTMKKIEGDNVFNIKLSEEEKFIIIKKIMNLLNVLHNYEYKAADKTDLLNEYYTKTMNRLKSIQNVIPFADRQTIYINGNSYKNPILNNQIFKEAVENTLMDTVYCPIHGDCTLTNILIDKSLNNIYFIDPRGYFGRQTILGDIRYDWAKLYYSLFGNFDRFNIKDFKLKICENEVFYSISSNGWESMLPQFFNGIEECDAKEIRFIHSIIWLSLASHCWEDYDSMCLAFYNGVVLVNEFL